MQWLRDNPGRIAKSADVETLAETTTLGAAYAVGYWKAVEDLRANWGKDHEWTPQMPAKQRQALYTGWKKAMTRTFIGSNNRF
jgi:glycerol kinase